MVDRGLDVTVSLFLFNPVMWGLTEFFHIKADMEALLSASYSTTRGKRHTKQLVHDRKFLRKAIAEGKRAHCVSIFSIVA